MDALILSNLRDTNGQNERFVRAARKHGEDPNVIHALAIGRSDPAAVVARFKVAAEKYGGISIREAHKAPYDQFQFPEDILWNRRTEQEIKRLADNADVIHLNNSEVAYRHFGLRKPALLHHHGSLFRSSPKRLLDIARHGRWVQATSTIDLLKFAPDVLTWLPSAYDIDAMAEQGKAGIREPDGRVLIVHCPTNRAFKHTELLISVVATLQAAGLPVDLELVEGQTWKDSLAAKARADIVFDQLMWGYGCNGIEAWAMGKPVIAGADEWTLAEMKRQWGELPFAVATEETLAAVIIHLAHSEDARAEWAERGMAHVRRYHDEKPALEKLAELYADAIRTYHKPRIEGKGEAVTFRQHRRQPVYYEDGPIPFVDGAITTDDPLVIQRLRTLSKRPARFGIEEVA